MDRAAATAEAQRLNAEHPDRDRYRWAVAGSEEKGFSVARIPLRPGQRLHPLKETTEARPKPSPAEDPRDSFQRNVPPYAAG